MLTAAMCCWLATACLSALMSICPDICPDWMTLGDSVICVGTERGKIGRQERERRDRPKEREERERQEGERRDRLKERYT